MITFLLLITLTVLVKAWILAIKDRKKLELLERKADWYAEEFYRQQGKEVIRNMSKKKKGLTFKDTALELTKREGKKFGVSVFQMREVLHHVLQIAKERPLEFFQLVAKQK